MHPRTPNRLQYEKSPYLLQHAQNPVDWYPWGDEAFAAARSADKPVFLSIGYSTCHWCHVMERESFENDEVASRLNDVFICVKLDREERPDVDHLYMTVCQLATGSGGWPLTVLLTPDRSPFFVATYIPRDSHAGRIGMLELIPRIATLWRESRETLLAPSARIAQALASMDQPDAADLPTPDALAAVVTSFRRAYDPQNGGFGSAPKFPSPHLLLFLLRHDAIADDASARDMTRHTLTSMRMGGVWDHVGFGFHRYATDNRWLLPHFEKMLYDQAMLTLAYTEAAQTLGEPLFHATAEQVIAYVLRDLRDPCGAFHAAEDADSEGEEGRFYVWTDAQVQAVLAAPDATWFRDIFRFQADGNFADEATGRHAGSNIPHLASPLSAAQAARFAPLREQLFDARESRVHPHRDDKILTDWNGLMIAALARAAAVFDRREWSEAAGLAADFLLAQCRAPDGGLLHRYRDGEAAIAGMLDDYAFLAWGLVELYHATQDVQRLRQAVELVAEAERRFLDPKTGTCFTSEADTKDLLVRVRSFHDGALPSGNAAMLHVLVQLGALTADPHLRQAAQRLATANAAAATSHPLGHAMWLTAMYPLIHGSIEVVVAGPDTAHTRDILRELRRRLPAHAVLAFRNTDAPHDALQELAPWTASLSTGPDGARIHVCRNGTCRLPVQSTAEALQQALHGDTAP